MEGEECVLVEEEAGGQLGRGELEPQSKEWGQLVWGAGGMGWA